MTIEYTYNINAARVVAENGLTDVVKEVEATLTGSDGAATFALPITVKLADADASSFTAFADLTEEQLVAWVSADPSLEGTRAHIAYVVEKEAAKLAMENKPLPWAPPPAEPAAPEAAE